MRSRVIEVTESWLKCKRLNGRLIPSEECDPKCIMDCQRVYRKVRRFNGRFLR
jgi:hypothetical protein